MAGITSKDRVQIAVEYGVWTAGFGFQSACEKVGAMALPVGPGNIEIQCQFLEDLQSTVLCCTAAMGLLMAEEIHRRGLTNKIKLKKILYGSERSSTSMRNRMSELFDGAELFDITGLTELYGPGAGVECQEHTGIHYWADYYILEIIDPETMQPLPKGELGEMVVTTLTKEGVPLIRYRTRDIARILPGKCACGSLMPRHSRITGRSDDMFNFRAVKIYPSTIDAVLSEITGIGSEYQIHLSRNNSNTDIMRLLAESEKDTERNSKDELTQKIIRGIKQKILVTPSVEILDYGTLPRSERKSKRVFDTRIENP